MWSSIGALLREGRPAQHTTKYEPPKKKATLLESDTDEMLDSIEKCVERYRAESAIGTEIHPQQWWSKHKGAHIRLTCLARKYLATPAISVPRERVFFVGGGYCLGILCRRASLPSSSDHVKKLVCLSSAKKYRPIAELQYTRVGLLFLSPSSVYFI